MSAPMLSFTARICSNWLTRPQIRRYGLLYQLDRNKTTIEKGISKSKENQDPATFVNESLRDGATAESTNSLQQDERSKTVPQGACSTAEVRKILHIWRVLNKVSKEKLMKIFPSAVDIHFQPLDVEGKMLKTAFVKFDTESQLQEAQKIQKRHGKIIIDGFRSNMKVVDLSHHQTESLMEAVKLEKENSKKISGEKNFATKENLSQFEQIQKSRSDEASRSVLIKVKGKADVSYLLDEFKSKNVPVKCACYSEPDHLLVEFKDHDCIEKLFRNVGHFRGNAFSKIPVRVRTRYLFKEEHGKTTLMDENRLDSKSVNVFKPNNFNLGILKQNAQLSEGINLLWNNVKLTEYDIRLQYFIASTLKEMLSNMFPHCNASLFGSCVNGFGNTGCDLDITLDLKQKSADSEEAHILKFLTNQRFNSEREWQQHLLDIIGNMVWVFVPSSGRINKILNARVPIVKFQHNNTRRECDISLNGMSGVKMAELMFTFGELCPEIRQLVTVIKQWASAKGVTKESQPGPWMSNFMLIMMTAFYLQNRKLLPSFRQMQEVAVETERYIEDGHDYSFSTNIDLLKKKFLSNESVDQTSFEESVPDVGTLLQDFFKFYADFDFEKYSISVVEGVPVEKKTFNALFIENPLDVEHNVSRNVNAQNVNKLIQEIQEAHEIICGSSPTLYHLLERRIKNVKSNSFNISSLFKESDVTQETVNQDNVEGIKDNMPSTTDTLTTEASKDGQSEEDKDLIS
ncbi:poly(A) RNA polymerase, mitochondrial-like isoform X2 [Mytilus galloprovincialis]|uniref:poly(A) RNA polymerase, mitochondrial-like isoform X2 n=1 Tax=Mytilus galloprovincialis TaxID=29158 RepID=UPI003F7C4CF2